MWSLKKKKKTKRCREEQAHIFTVSTQLIILILRKTRTTYISKVNLVEFRSLQSFNLRGFKRLTVGPVFGGDDSSVHIDKTEREGIWEIISEGFRVGTSVPVSKFKAESPRVWCPLSSLALLWVEGFREFWNVPLRRQDVLWKVLASLAVFWLLSSESSLGNDRDLILLTAGMGGRDTLEDSDIFSQLPNCGKVIKPLGLWRGLKSSVARSRDARTSSSCNTDPEPPLGKLLSNNWATIGPVVPTKMFLNSSFSSIVFNSRLSNGSSSHSKSAGLKSAFVWGGLRTFCFVALLLTRVGVRMLLCCKLARMGLIGGGIVAVQWVLEKLIFLSPSGPLLEFTLASASSALSSSRWASWIFLMSSAHSTVFFSKEKSYCKDIAKKGGVNELRVAAPPQCNSPTQFTSPLNTRWTRWSPLSKTKAS